jgi:hypothetical protein
VSDERMFLILCGVCDEPLSTDDSKVVFLPDYKPAMMCLDCAIAVVGEEKARANTWKKRTDEKIAEILRKD